MRARGVRLHCERVGAIRANPPKFLTDEKALRIAVVLDIAEYERMLEELEDQEDIRACNEVKASREEAIPLDDAARMVTVLRVAHRSEVYR